MSEFNIGDKVQIKTVFESFLMHSVLPKEYNNLIGVITDARPAAPDYGHDWLMYFVKVDSKVDTIPCRAGEMVKLND